MLCPVPVLGSVTPGPRVGGSERVVQDCGGALPWTMLYKCCSPREIILWTLPWKLTIILFHIMRCLLFLTLFASFIANCFWLWNRVCWYAFALFASKIMFAKHSFQELLLYPHTKILFFFFIFFFTLAKFPSVLLLLCLIKIYLPNLVSDASQILLV